MQQIDKPSISVGGVTNSTVYPASVYVNQRQNLSDRLGKQKHISHIEWRDILKLLNDQWRIQDFP